MPNKLIEPEEPKAEITIKTLIINDEASFFSTAEEEAQDIADQFLRHYNIKLNYKRTDNVLELDEYMPELVILDIGGLTTGYSDLPYRMTNYVVKWMEEHPSRFLIIWTEFTSRVYRYEFATDFDHLHNIIHWYPMDEGGFLKLSYKTEDIFKYQDEIVDRLKNYFRENEK